MGAGVGGDKRDGRDGRPRPAQGPGPGRPRGWWHLLCLSLSAVALVRLSCRLSVDRVYELGASVLVLLCGSARSDK